MNKEETEWISVPVTEKLLLTISEASALSGIGTTTLQRLARDPRCTWVLWNGNKKMVKRKSFERWIESTLSI